MGYSTSYVNRYATYKLMLMDTLGQIKVAMAEGDKQHLDILLDRMEKQITNKFKGYG